SAPSPLPSPPSFSFSFSPLSLLLSPGGSSDSSREEDSAIPFPSAGVGFRPGAERSRAAPMEEPTGNTVVIRIGIPDLQQTKCLKFNVDAPIWLSKQRILCSLNQSLKDVLNYGLFQPAFNGKRWMFLSLSIQSGGSHQN
uniref:Talin N-terminal F0 domain-containing protein n=1 Tax=Periophthalmus magnuspinnatus TaxID=409849 RepID=A0A3B4AUR0_9GOBI